MPTESHKFQNTLKAKTLSSKHLSFKQILNICLKKHPCRKNPESLYTTKVSKHTACDYPIFTECIFDYIKTKYDH